MTDAERMEAIRTMIREELSSIKADINDHKQTHDELEALVEKRFNEIKEMFPEGFGSAFYDWGMILNDIFII